MPVTPLLPRDWQRLLHETIPLTAFMQVAVSLLSDGRVRLDAPLAPNHNDKGTGFGGSIATLATLAGWVECQRLLDTVQCGQDVDIVVQHGETQYLAPVETDFHALPLAGAASDTDRFLRMFQRKGVARLTVAVEVRTDQCCARFEGDYVASRRATR
jgi:thioesterase domain-containing protein